ncbi:hypothetical protein JKS41_09610 [Listeria monocytogenes]|nr:hypothetical protein [Listeria monocytogenes]MCP7985418.1 hypothetical protein [Listeria monocytogenes]MCP7990184.1 hypothetical protein [Listeria monocytogenes]MCP8005963.1 hypothetical protein [Listeria monocytogenes]
MRPTEYKAFVKKEKKTYPVTDLCFSEYDDDQVCVRTCENNDCRMCLDWYSFNDVEIIEFTGLTDKNGRKIFEGDICWDEHNECHGVVVYEEGKFLYVWENIATDLCEINRDIVIAGDIFNNPELLRGVDDE